MTFPTSYTTPDCHLDGVPVELEQWAILDSNELGRIVGMQQPGEDLEKSEHCT